MTGTETHATNPPVGKAHTMSTIRHYVGGTRNIDGAVTCTTGVDAPDPATARQRLAERLNNMYPGHGYTADDIGIVSARPAKTDVPVDGNRLRGSVVIPESSTLFSWDVAKIVDALRTTGIADRDANITVSLPNTAPGVATATWVVSA